MLLYQHISLKRSLFLEQPSHSDTLLLCRAPNQLLNHNPSRSLVLHYGNLSQAMPFLTSLISRFLGSDPAIPVCLVNWHHSQKLWVETWLPYRLNGKRVLTLQLAIFCQASSLHPPHAQPKLSPSLQSCTPNSQLCQPQLK